MVITTLQSGLRPSFSYHLCCVRYCAYWDLQFKIDSEQQIFEKYCMVILFAGRVFFFPEICWKDIIIFFTFEFVLNFLELIRILELSSVTYIRHSIYNRWWNWCWCVAVVCLIFPIFLLISKKSKKWFSSKYKPFFKFYIQKNFRKVTSCFPHICINKLEWLSKIPTTTITATTTSNYNQNFKFLAHFPVW